MSPSVVLMGLVEHFDPVGGHPQWVRGPQADLARLLGASWGRGPTGQPESGSVAWPSLYEEEGVRTDSILFYGGETKVLNG